MLRPYDLFGGAKARVSASLGVSLFPDDAGDAATLMAHADKAMYAAKRAGKNAFCIFSASNGRQPQLGRVHRPPGRLAIPALHARLHHRAALASAKHEWPNASIEDHLRARASATY
jgi:hypothetical protein